jgi:hypothetical protein
MTPVRIYFILSNLYILYPLLYLPLPSPYVYTHPHPPACPASCCYWWMVVGVASLHAFTAASAAGSRGRRSRAAGTGRTAAPPASAGTRGSCWRMRLPAAAAGPSTAAPARLSNSKPGSLAATARGQGRARTNSTP